MSFARLAEELTRWGGVMLFVIERCTPAELVATYGLTASHMQMVAQACTQQGTSPGNQEIFDSLIRLIHSVTRGDERVMMTTDVDAYLVWVAANIFMPSRSGHLGKGEVCAPGYEPCLPDFGVDYDCRCGGGNGPRYTGQVSVTRDMDI